MEYGCVFVMRPRQGLSGKAGSPLHSGRGWGAGALIGLLKGLPMIGAGQGRQNPRGLPQV